MTATFHIGDAIEVMGKLPEKSVDLILTSPPFLALRSYLPSDHPDKALEGGSQSTPGGYIDWLIDVVEACDRVLAPHGSLCIELGDTYSGSGGGGGDYLEGGWREGQAQFAGSAASMKESNAAHWRQKNQRVPAQGLRYPCQHDRYEAHTFLLPGGHPESSIAYADCPGGAFLTPGTGWPLAKSLSLIPELFRLTLVYGFNPLTGRQTERWRLRNVVRWVRPNPPVGALGDKFRPATSELMVFCKSAKRYFDLDAVREPYKFPDHPQIGKTSHGGKEATGLKDGNWDTFPVRKEHPAGAPPLDWWQILASGITKLRKPCEHVSDEFPEGHYEEHILWKELDTPICPGGESLTADLHTPLDWWNIPPGGYEGAHYAVWPPELCVKPVKAMSPERVCRTCGEPSRRITDVSYTPHDDPVPQHAEAKAGSRGQAVDRLALREQNPPAMANGRATKNVETLGFSDCGHNEWRPGVVLDPFAGSGTTLAVATGHGRDAIGIDLDSRNFDLALDRVGPFILERG